MNLHPWVGRLFFACFLFFALMTAASRIIPHLHAPVPGDPGEDWRPELSRVRSIDAAMGVLPAYVAREKGSREARTAAAIDHFVRDRFVHGTSLISYHHNWLAALSGAVWLDLRMPLLPDDILHHRRAVCNQQAIVFMEMLKRSGIRYASVLMSWPGTGGDQGHFAAAARVDGRWLYFDPDAEAAQEGVPVELVADGSALPRLYGNKPELVKRLRYAAAHHRITLAHVDTYPAPRGGLFQQVTRWMSAYGWLLFGLLALAQVLLARCGRGGATSAMLVPAE